MSELPSKVKLKIENLSKRTVRNGASESEEKTAQEMIARILERYNQNMSPSIERPIHGNKPMDWDFYAKRMFNAEQYYEYCDRTTEAWERLMTGKFGVSIDGKDTARISNEEYQRTCASVFYDLYYKKEGIFTT